MPTLRELAEETQRLMEGGIATDESRLDYPYVYSVINDSRANVLRKDFLKFKRWSPQAMQTFYPEYESYYQDSVCYTRFQLPTGFIQANPAQDGLIYIGSLGEKIFEIQSFFRIKNRNELADFMGNPRLNPAKAGYVGVLLEGLVATVIAKENMIENIQVVGVFEDPTMLPDYNINIDQYPISGDLLGALQDDVLKSTMAIVYSKPIDTMSDSKSTVQQQAK